MIKPIFPKGRLVIAAIMGLFVLFAFALLIVELSQQRLSGILNAALIIVFGGWSIWSILRPRCLSLVRPYIRYRELKEILCQQHWQTYQTLHYSQKWVYVDDVYLLRVMVKDVLVQKKKKGAQLFLETTNGTKLYITQVQDGSAKSLARQIKKRLDPQPVSPLTKETFRQYA